MKSIKGSKKLFISESKVPNAGRGVFAGQKILSGETIEIAPVLLLSKEDYSIVKKTKLRNYYFLSEDELSAAICLGYGSIYNHSYEPNATYEKRLDESLVLFKAISDIEEGEEITVNYNYGVPEDQSTLWIDEIPSAGTDQKKQKSTPHNSV